MNSNRYDGTTSLTYQIAEVLNLCSIASTNTISKLTKKACEALGLPVTSTSGKKSPADNKAIFEWLRNNVANKSAPVADTTADLLMAKIAASDALAIEANAPAPQTLFDNVDIDDTADLFAVDTATPSNVARLTESFSNEMAHAPVQIRHVSHLNQSMQVVINADVILDIKATHALALDFRKVSAMHGQRVGELLLQVKAELKHGDFLPWLEKYVGVSTRQANRYMRGAKGLPAPIHTVNQIGRVSYLNPPADLVAQVESLETETLRLENEKLQNELIAAQQAADELAAKVGAVQQQNDDLRGNINAQVSAATVETIATERAALIVENSSAMQSLEKQLSDANDKIAQQKKDYDKDVKDGVARGLGAKEIEIMQLDYRINNLRNDESALIESRDLLSGENLALQVSQTSTKDINNALEDILGAIVTAEEEGNISVEWIEKWRHELTEYRRVGVLFETFVNRGNYSETYESTAIRLPIIDINSMDYPL
jgi:hypothetical protein